MYDYLLKEHEGRPGKVYKDCLLVEVASGFLFNECNLYESARNNGKSLLTFKGKFQEADAVNKNKRMYPFAILDENVKKLAETIKTRGLIGELDHPSDSIVHYKDSSHLITKLWWENNVLMGEGQILNTPCGKVLKNLIEDGVRVGISSRGVGNGKVNEDGILVIGESYKLITFDAVADPSCYAAFQQRIVNKEDYDSTPENYYQSPKNEGTRIHNSDVLVAVLGELIKNNTRARLING